MKVIHVKLNDGKDTCLTKEDMLECLKYWGRTISSKAFRLCILKEQTFSLLFLELRLLGISWKGEFLGWWESSVLSAQLTILSNLFYYRISNVFWMKLLTAFAPLARLSRFWWFDSGCACSCSGPISCREHGASCSSILWDCLRGEGWKGSIFQFVPYVLN